MWTDSVRLVRTQRHEDTEFYLRFLSRRDENNCLLKKLCAFVPLCSISFFANLFCFTIKIESWEWIRIQTNVLNFGRRRCGASSAPFLRHWYAGTSSYCSSSYARCSSSYAPCLTLTEKGKVSCGIYSVAYKPISSRKKRKSQRKCLLLWKCKMYEPYEPARIKEISRRDSDIL